jgi:hypothetical protein
LRKKATFPHGEMGTCFGYCFGHRASGGAGLGVDSGSRSRAGTGYNGKPLSYWFAQLDSPTNYNNNTAYQDAMNAVSQVGTNAIPILLQMLRANDSLLKTKVLTWAAQRRFLHFHYTKPNLINVRATWGFHELGPRAASAVPELVKILEQNISPESEWQTANALGFIGPEAKAAVPLLLRAAQSTNDSFRGSAFWALAGIHADADAVVPVLIRGLRDPNAVVRADAASGLGQFRSDARSAVPALVAILVDPNAASNSVPLSRGVKLSVRSFAETALQQIDPETYARVVTNTGPDSTK